MLETCFFPLVIIDDFLKKKIRSGNFCEHDSDQPLGVEPVGGRLTHVLPGSLNM